MARDKKKKSQAADRRRPIKKKTSILSSESIDWVDYKDVNLLRRFMSERAKIRARRVTGNSAQQQRAVARAIRIAREMALLPYSVRQVTQRSRGGRRDRGDRDRGDRDRGDRDRGDRDRMPEPPPEREPAAAADDGGASGSTEGGNGADVPVEVTADDAAPAPAGGEDQS
jgi:small subunit ribosomal protein S18